MKWRKVSSGQFYDANESTVVYYDSHSGDTHLLSDFAAWIVQQFSEDSLTIEQLREQLSGSIDPQDLAQLTNALPGVLGELVTLDIIKRE